MLTNPASVRCESCEFTPIVSPARPIAVRALARKLMLENVGFADTDIRIGVEEQLRMSRLEHAGFDTPNSARPWPASLSRQLETGMFRFLISTRPCVAL